MAALGAFSEMKATVMVLGAALTAMASVAMASVEDSDGNGLYSYEEMAAGYEGLSEELFAEIDADGDGEVSDEEFEAAVEAGLIEG